MELNTNQLLRFLPNRK